MRQTLVPLAGILLAAALGGCSEVYYYPLRHEGDFVYFEQASQQPYAPAFVRRTDDYLALDLRTCTWAFTTPQPPRSAPGWDRPPTRANRLPPGLAAHFAKTGRELESAAVDTARRGIWGLGRDGRVWFVSTDPPGEPADLKVTEWARVHITPAPYPPLEPDPALVGPDSVWFTPWTLSNGWKPAKAVAVLSIAEHQARVLTVPAHADEETRVCGDFILVGDDLWYVVVRDKSYRVVRRRPQDVDREETVADLGKSDHFPDCLHAGRHLVVVLGRQVFVIDAAARRSTACPPPDRRGGERALFDAVTVPPQAAFQVVYIPYFFFFVKW